MRFLFVSVFILSLFASCEKDINFTLDQKEQLLVVDANIETGNSPVIVLTKTTGYFKTLSAEALANSFVRNAEVYVSIGSQTHKLKEYAVPLANGFTGYYYSNDTANPSTMIFGAPNKSYNLKVITDGKEYTSTTMIPAFNASLDSVWVKPAPNNPDTNKRILNLRITDPVGRGNYVRYFTKKNSERFLPGENSVFDDQIIDGTTFDVQLSPGIDRNDPPKPDSNFFKKGDTITMKFCDIDKATYTFWNTWEFAFQSIGNPFAQPNKIIGNISNGALGAFCGYAVRYKTIVAK